MSQNLPRRWICENELACFRGPKITKSKPVNASALTSASKGLDHHDKTEAYQRWTPKMKGFLARGLHRSWQGPSPTSIGPLTSTWSWSSSTNSRWTFWGTTNEKVLHTKCCQHGHQFFFTRNTISLVRGVTQIPGASDRPPACASLSSRWNWRSNKGWVLLTCFDYHQIFWSFHCITLCFTFNSDWLPHYTNKLLSCMVRHMVV